MSHQSNSQFPLVVISTLGIYIKRESRKQIEFICLEAGRETRRFQQTLSPGHGHQESFEPPLEVSLNAKIVVSVQYRKIFRGVVTIPLEPQDVLYGAVEEDGKQLYRKTERKIDVIIGLQSLRSTVSDIMASCSRFRVLIIGETGVGKSSLINKVFGVASVDVSDTTRGQAHIDQEYIARDNAHFVVHDSCGFEAADQQNLTVVRNFISSRKCRRDLKDQLHVVWLCLETPYAGGRLLEVGTEEFLKNRKQILGNIPLIVVFTKLDLLVNAVGVDSLSMGENLDGAMKERVQQSLNSVCLAPVQKAVGSGSLSHVAVSTKEGYEDTLASLVKETTNNIQTYVKDEAAQYAATIAQRVNLSLKIALTIAIGEKRYWKALQASSNFGGRTMKACLHVIHEDIVTVWNFNDPDNVILTKDDFKASLLDTPNLRVGATQDPQRTVQTGVTMIAALVTIIAGIAGTGGAAIPIVVPIAGIALLAKLGVHLYKASQDIVRQLMAYIVDMTCVMQAIFLLAAAGNGVVTVEMVAIAMQAYAEADRGSVHNAINAFNVRFAVAPGKRDDVLEKVKALIEEHRIRDGALSTLRQKLAEGAGGV